jgi:eukaryotic-like serine/threonine-protein kinase
MHCLERSRKGLGALVALFVAADDVVVLHAVEAAAKLEPLGRCADVVSLREEGRPTDPHIREAMDALEERLAEARSLEYAGRPGDALKMAGSVLERAEALDIAILESEAALAAASALGELGQHEDSVQMLHRALFAAESAGVELWRAKGLVKLAYAVGYHGASFDLGSWYLELARELAERVEDEDLSSEILGVSGVLEAARGRPEAAKPWLRRALEMHRARGGHAINTTVMLANLANVHFELGEYELALDLGTEARDLSIAVHGDGHSATVITLETLGNILHVLGRSEEALEHHRRAIELAEGAGRSGTGHALALNNEATVLAGLSRHAEAIARYEQAIAHLQEGRDPPIRAVLLSNMAESYIELGRSDQAIPLFEEALRLLEETLGQETVYHAAAQTGLGHALVERGRHDEAIVELEPALQRMRRLTADEYYVAEAEFHLARALAATAEDGETLVRARALTEHAHAVSRGMGERGAQLEAACAAWLEAHAASHDGAP